MLMRRGVGLILCTLTLIVTNGCDSRVPKQELGTVVFEVPRVPGSDKPFEMPELEQAPGPTSGQSAAKETGK
jgi:hypothetical protein